MSVLDDAASGLRTSPLYVHPDALAELQDRGADFDTSTAADALAGAATPIRVAVLPMSAAAENLARDVAVATGANGTYLVLLPDETVSTATNIGVDAGDVQRVAQTARANADGDFAALITDFADRVDDLAAGGTGAPTGTTAPTNGGSGYVPLAILLAAGGGGFLIYRRRKRQREVADLNQVRTALDEDITAYGEELTALDLDVRSDDVVPGSQDDYARALDLYELAKSAAARAESPGHLRPVTASLEEGRWLLARVRARANGADLPDRRPPCFFDPRHGPSVADVPWTPPGGVPREVPACQADIVRLQDGQAPDSRLVTVDGERRPYWEAGPAYSAWAAGYYGGFLPAMLWGTMLGSTMAYGGAGAGYDSGGFDSGGYDSGGFDSGGVDSGGFDSGGIDFGGFDF